MKKVTKSELKQYLKALAIEISALRKTRKSVPYGYVAGLQNKSYDYRHHHIAYCLFRGRTLEQIEKPAEGNACSMPYVERILETIVPNSEVSKDAEAVCDRT